MKKCRAAWRRVRSPEVRDAREPCVPARTVQGRLQEGLVAGGRAARRRRGGPDPGQSPGARRVGAGGRGTRSRRCGDGGRGASSGAPDPAAHRAHDGVALHVLPRRRAAHGQRPGDAAACRHLRPALRRRAPLQLRHLRLARAHPRVRHQRPRRDQPGAVGLGPQAAHHQLRPRGSRQRSGAAFRGGRAHRGPPTSRRSTRWPAWDGSSVATA